jgi:large subunit ribosomal protein L5
MAKKEQKPEKGAKAPKKGDKAPKKGDKTPKKGDKAPKKGDKAPKKGDKAPDEPQGPPPTPRLQERYKKEILPALAQSLKRTNRLSLPRLRKIVVNMGVGSAIGEKKHLEEALDAMKLLAGQQPVVTRGRKSVAGFRLREGMAIGCMVTLRGRRMYEFLDRLISLALPRVRDFRGLNPKAFDGHGNYSLGLSEQLVFPELNPDKYSRSQGMNITIVTTTDKDDEARELLRGFGLPMRAA